MTRLSNQIKMCEPLAVTDDRDMYVVILHKMPDTSSNLRK